jgi:hypothetical protein
MREDTLRAVLMVKAIEETDRAGTLLPPADRAQATREAVRAQSAMAGEPVAAPDDAFLARALGARAERLLPPLVQRFPIVDEALGRTRTPQWLLLALLVLAFASGLGLSAMDGSKRINILALPFLGLVAWNLVVYALLAAAWVKARTASPAASLRRGNVLARLLERRVEPLLRTTRRVHAVLGEALGRYASNWASFGAACTAQHARRWLHLAAAVVALGLIVGLYVRGTVLRYEAGWESTFLGPAAVRAVLDVVFGPVTGWSGVALPATLAEFEQLRWTATGGGGDAAPWIHLIALSLLCYVVVPRLLLAGAATLTLAHQGRASALPQELRPYAADVLRGSGVLRSTGLVSVTPYAYEPSAAALAGLERWLRSALGGAVQVERRTSLRYGEEDMAGTAFALGAHRAADLHVLLMNLAATPEAENHGVVIAAARDAAHQARPPAAVRVVVDESPYAERFGGDASFAPRLEERRRLWRDFVAGYGLAAEIGDMPNFGDGDMLHFPDGPSGGASSIVTGK